MPVSILFIGDIIGNPMLAHKAVHEGHVAAEVAAGQKVAFEANVIPGVAYTHPEVAWVGITEAEAKKEGRNRVCLEPAAVSVVSAEEKALLFGISQFQDIE